MRTINGPFLAVLLAAGLFFSAATYFVHDCQVRHNAGALLDQARQGRGSGQHRSAIRYYQRYLGFEPWNVAALAEYGFTLEQVAQDSKAQLRAYLTLEEVLLRAPERVDVRRRQADLALKLGRLGNAIAHFRVLHEDAPSDGELLVLLAKAEKSADKYADAARHYQTALEQNFHTIDTYVHLASLLQKQPKARAALVKGCTKPRSAEAVMAEMVRQHPQSYQSATLHSEVQ